MSAPAIATPCVRICVVDPMAAIGVGCGWAVAEIAAWRDLSDKERGGLGERVRWARSRPASGGRRQIRARAHGGNR